MKKFILQDAEGLFAEISVDNGRYPISFPVLAAAQVVYDKSNDEWFKFPAHKIGKSERPTWDEYLAKHKAPDHFVQAKSVVKTIGNNFIVVAYAHASSGFYCGGTDANT